MKIRLRMVRKQFISLRQVWYWILGHRAVIVSAGARPMFVFNYFKVSLTLRTMLKSKTCSGSTGCLGLTRTEASAIICR